MDHPYPLVVHSEQHGPDSIAVYVRDGERFVVMSGGRSPAPTFSIVDEKAPMVIMSNELAPHVAFTLRAVLAAITA